MNISYDDGRRILDLKITLVEKALMMALILYMNPETKRIYPSIETLANDLDLSPSTVQRKLKVLCEKNLIAKTKQKLGGRLHNFYEVVGSVNYDLAGANKAKAEAKAAAKAEAKAAAQDTQTTPTTTSTPSEPAKKPGRKTEFAELDWKLAREDTVAHCESVPSVFVDVTYGDLEQQGFLDGYDRKVTPETFRNHCYRMWKHSKHKRFYNKLEKAYDEFWDHCNAGMFAGMDSKTSKSLKEYDIVELEKKYHVDWNDDEEAPDLGHIPSYNFYPGKKRRY